MKNLILLIAFGIFSAANIFAQSSYGKKVDEKSAITVQELHAQMKDSKQMDATVYGKVFSVCQAEGCWMKIENGDGTAMMVRMKNHEFTLPKDIIGKNAVFTGVATVKETSVDMLRHYAADEGKSKEYIDAIKDPQTELTFEASGVVIK